MTEIVARCAWCGRRLPAATGRGRPRRFCRRSHRQRHYEARRLAGVRGLGGDEVLVARRDLEAWRDRLYLLAAALEDAEQDLAGAPALKDYVAAYLHVHQAAQEVVSARLEPLALGS